MAEQATLLLIIKFSGWSAIPISPARGSMVDFKEKTNPLMVGVIAIYLAAELLCPRPSREWTDQCEPGRGAWPREAGRICQVKRCEQRASRADLIAA